MISCFRFSFKIIFVCFLISSCAIKVAPQGGKTDSVPPKAVEFSPANFSNRFDSKKIEIAFDEFFQLKDLNGQLVVSPIISREPEITVKNKSIVIKLDGPLSPNTTYSINFGNAIADVHENNVLENFRYVFSTGDFVDSLSLSGKVMNAKNHSLEKSVLVMLRCKP